VPASISDRVKKLCRDVIRSKASLRMSAGIVSSNRSLKAIVSYLT